MIAIPHPIAVPIGGGGVPYIESVCAYALARRTLWLVGICAQYHLSSLVSSVCALLCRAVQLQQ